MSLRDSTLRRNLVWLAVVLAHTAFIAALLLSSQRAPREWRGSVASLSLLHLPNESARIDTTKTTVWIHAAASHPSMNEDLPLPKIPSDNNSITLSPAEQRQQRTDWDREAALAVQSSLDQAAQEKNYRDLSSLTREQLDWAKKNHLEPIQGFEWDRNSRGEMLRHGIFKINDYCVLIVVIPFCRFGGTIQYSGDLFKNMHDPKSPDK